MNPAPERRAVIPPPGNSPVGAEEDASIAGEEDPGAALDEPQDDGAQPAVPCRSERDIPRGKGVPPRRP